jgi:hypothetical protein
MNLLCVFSIFLIFFFLFLKTCHSVLQSWTPPPGFGAPPPVAAAPPPAFGAPPSNGFGAPPVTAFPAAPAMGGFAPPPVGSGGAAAFPPPAFGGAPPTQTAFGSPPSFGGAGGGAGLPPPVGAGGTVGAPKKEKKMCEKCHNNKAVAKCSVEVPNSEPVVMLLCTSCVESEKTAREAAQANGGSEGGTRLSMKIGTYKAPKEPKTSPLEKARLFVVVLSANLHAL